MEPLPGSTWTPRPGSIARVSVSAGRLGWTPASQGGVSGASACPGPFSAAPAPSHHTPSLPAPARGGEGTRLLQELTQPPPPLLHCFLHLLQPPPLDSALGPGCLFRSLSRWTRFSDFPIRLHRPRPCNLLGLECPTTWVRAPPPAVPPSPPGLRRTAVPGILPLRDRPQFQQPPSRSASTRTWLQTAQVVPGAPCTCAWAGWGGQHLGFELGGAGLSPGWRRLALGRA